MKYYVHVLVVCSFNFIKNIFRDETCTKEIEISDSPEEEARKKGLEARKQELEARRLERELEAKVFLLFYYGD